MRAYHSPPNMEEDEITIKAGYGLGWFEWLVVAIPFVAAQFADLKWVVAAGFGALIVVCIFLQGRMYDVCVRLRRTNILLNERLSSRIGD
jgi:hypothetical protein